ncbi:MAG: hypothetical protein DRH90_09240 [Deltaproteobacteria bacterium]|nr:MAG: hypothetical protein DRH90_09240 [Deltaproteobacteria bacterium]RLC17267.1 MAG: hypothetical protein DRI24_06190 [Deltaproteobacteria bacterium]
MLNGKVLMKQFSSIIIGSAVFALIMVSSVAARYISVPAETIVDNFIKTMEPSKEFMYLAFVGLISCLIGTLIRPR